MTDLLRAILTSNNPRCLNCGDPATETDDPFTWCKRCHDGLVASLRASGFPEINSSSCGGVESRHAVNSGLNGETPARTSEDRLETLEQVPLLPLPGQREGRSQKGEANVGRKPSVEHTAGLAPGPQDSIGASA